MHTNADSNLKFIKALVGNSDSLTKRLSALHDRLLEISPVVSRIACALYAPEEDLLKTFISSTREGTALTDYEYKLSNSSSLSQLAKSGGFRVLENISDSVQPDTAHSQWLLEQGYRSSFTLPIFEQFNLLGFVFFDSKQPAAFSADLQRDLVFYGNLIGMAISTEVSTIRKLIDSIRMARRIAAVRDFETGAHLERVAEFSRLIAKQLAAKHGLDDEFVESVHLYSQLHDIGKIGIPDKILLKEGKLTTEERQAVCMHVRVGMDIVENILGGDVLRQMPNLAVLKNIVAYHHERMDGSGYLEGLSGDQIPIEARIVAVADVFDALTSRRPYKQSWNSADALAELERLRDEGQLDPDCVQALMQNLAEVENIRLTHQDAQEPSVACLP